MLSRDLQVPGGGFCLNADAAYLPGMRLYFDLHRIIRYGIAVRDGLHLPKMRDQLPLIPYLLDPIGAEDVNTDDAGSDWTPQSFVEDADRAFQRRRFRHANGHGDGNGSRPSPEANAEPSGREVPRGLFTRGGRSRGSLGRSRGVRSPADGVMDRVTTPPHRTDTRAPSGPDRAPAGW